MRKLNSKGFGGLETLLLVIIIAIIGGTGYYVYHANKQANKSYTQGQLANSQVLQSKLPLKTIALDGGNISLNVPKGWSLVTGASVCTGGYGQPSCVDGAEVSPTNANKAVTSDAFGINIAVHNKDDSSNNDWFFKNICGCLASPDWNIADLKINNYQASVITQTVPSYTDKDYLVSKGTTLVIVSARLKSTTESGTQPGTALGDNSRYDPVMKTIAESVHIK